MVFLQYTYICFSKLYRPPNFITDTQEAGVFFGFVEFEDMSGIQNALNVSLYCESFRFQLEKKIFFMDVEKWLSFFMDQVILLV